MVDLRLRVFDLLVDAVFFVWPEIPGSIVLPIISTQCRATTVRAAYESRLGCGLEEVRRVQQVAVPYSHLQRFVSILQLSQHRLDLYARSAHLSFSAASPSAERASPAGVVGLRVARHPASSSPALLRQENPKMDVRAATHEQMYYPDIKGHNVMTFVSRSACTQISLDNRKKSKQCSRQSMVSISNSK